MGEGGSVIPRWLHSKILATMKEIIRVRRELRKARRLGLDAPRA